MITFNEHVRWRKDINDIFICDCKRLIDLKVPFKFENSLKKLERGIENKKKLDIQEQKLFLDFEKLGLISKLEFRNITLKEFPEAMKILDEELNDRQRDNNFLLKKFKKFPQFFIGIFIDNRISGIICGFPREDYLLISEIAVITRFHGRGFGKKLVEKFESEARGKYNKINVGAEDNVLGFYLSLGYKPFLLIQYKKGEYNKKEFSEMSTIKERKDKFYEMLELKQDVLDINNLKKLRNKFPKAYFQYIFTKKL